MSDDVLINMKAAKYVNKLYDIKTLYCRMFTHEWGCYGAHSTQRSESTHNAVKGYVGNSTPIAEVPEGVERTCNGANDKASAIYFMRAWRVELRQATQAGFVQSCRDILTEYAYTYVCKEYLQAINYEVIECEGTYGCVQVKRLDTASERTPDGDNEVIDGIKLDADMYLRKDRIVFLIDGIPESCTCQTMSFMGLPCRHMMQVFVIRQLQGKFLDFIKEECADRWFIANNNRDAQLQRAINTMSMPKTYTAASTIDDPIASVPVEKRYPHIMYTAKQIACFSTQSKVAFEWGARNMEAVLNGMQGLCLGEETPPDVPLTSATTIGAKRKTPTVANPVTSRGPGRPKTKNKEGMNGATAARGHGQGQKRHKSMAADYQPSQTAQGGGGE